jgi:hypothetical protein
MKVSMPWRMIRAFFVNFFIIPLPGFLTAVKPAIAIAKKVMAERLWGDAGQGDEKISH